MAPDPRGDERRLHPFSWLFVLITQLRDVALPLIVLLLCSAAVFFAGNLRLLDQLACARQARSVGIGPRGRAAEPVVVGAAVGRDAGADVLRRLGLAEPGNVVVLAFDAGNIASVEPSSPNG